MNKSDRQELCSIKTQIQELVDKLREMGEIEQEKFDNLTEGLQASERGQRYQELADCIDSACSTIESGLEELEECEY